MPFCFYRGYGADNLALLSLTPAQAAAGWHHYCFTLGSGISRLYLDGAQVGSASGDLNWNTASPSRLCIGCANAASDGVRDIFGGYLAEVRVYNQLLSGSDISTIYSSYPPLATPTPVAYYPLESNYNDASGNGLHLSVYPSGSIPFVGIGGRVGASFDATKGLRSAATSLLPNGGWPRTVSAWANLPAGGSFNSILTMWGSQANAAASALIVYATGGATSNIIAWGYSSGEGWSDRL